MKLAKVLIVLTLSPNPTLTLTLTQLSITLTLTLCQVLPKMVRAILRLMRTRGNQPTGYCNLQGNE